MLSVKLAAAGLLYGVLTVIITWPKLYAHWYIFSFSGLNGNTRKYYITANSWAGLNQTSSGCIPSAQLVMLKSLNYETKNNLFQSTICYPERVERRNICIINGFSVAPSIWELTLYIIRWFSMLTDTTYGNQNRSWKDNISALRWDGDSAQYKNKDFLGCVA